MLAQDITEIQSKELRFVNQAVNMNKDRFRDYIDSIYLKVLKDKDLRDFKGFLLKEENLTEPLYQKQKTKYRA